ncbi:hypothetical protein TEA_029674 [Camellia sinensis var. sinensis]|uniref:Peptidase S8/S53 domain-containing protein n=1 Tax=Camellia sinensis var. sinensis TaxID=542762 RepID=A0A4V3WPA2_CAMSN|nr:hypothetical protein TEA_029674 [Camellia sinensis var. sinensis]
MGSRGGNGTNCHPNIRAKLISLVNDKVQLSSDGDQLIGGKGMSPPPAKWKGKCQFNASLYNNKLIGARSLNVAAKGLPTVLPLDDDGHGSHTASTAAGAFVKNADALGNAKGTAVGIAPHAHLAIYKVCFGLDCPDTDILAGLDATDANVTVSSLEQVEIA